MNSERTDFYRPIERVRTYKANDAGTRERAIRLYCTQSRLSWTLQVRAPMNLGSSGYGPEGKDFIIAGASLEVDDLRALRAALDAFIEEVEEESA